MAKKIRLMAAGEIARALRLGAAQTHVVIKTPAFPAPADALGVGKIWLADDVETWIRDTGRTLHPWERT